jgi:hypothetical protein
VTKVVVALGAPVVAVVSVVTVGWKYLVVTLIPPPEIPTVPVDAAVPVAFIYFVVAVTALPPDTAEI